MKRGHARSLNHAILPHHINVNFDNLYASPSGLSLPKTAKQTNPQHFALFPSTVQLLILNLKRGHVQTKPIKSPTEITKPINHPMKKILLLLKPLLLRSEERRVGKECRSRWSP